MYVTNIIHKLNIYLVLHAKKSPLVIKYNLIINMLLFIQVDKIVKESLNNAKNKKLKDKEIKFKANFRR